MIVHLEIVVVVVGVVDIVVGSKVVQIVGIDNSSSFSFLLNNSFRFGLVHKNSGFCNSLRYIDHTKLRGMLLRMDCKTIKSVLPVQIFLR